MHLCVHRQEGCAHFISSKKEHFLEPGFVDSTRGIVLWHGR